MIEKLGHYEIISELGRGGMGIVLKGRDPSLDRFVAIKILNKQIVLDETMVARFKREAKSAASLNHPNITQIYFIGEENEQHYFVMEFVDGESLSERIRREGQLGLATAAQILRQAALGLAAAHEKEIVHRDIKPGNIMITRQGIVKIADFGISFAPDPNQKLTVTGQFMGTPGYISPEIFLGQAMDHRSDIFSLGVVYFEMLAGEQPFKAESPYALIHQVVSAELPDIRSINDNVDPASAEILSKMLERKIEDRFQTCLELVAALDAGPAKGAGAHIPPIPSAGLAETQPIARTAAHTQPTEAIPRSENERITQVSPPMGNSAPAVPGMPTGQRQTLVEAPTPPTKTPPDVSGEGLSQPRGTVVLPPRPPVRKRSKLPWVAAAILVAALAVGGAAFGPGLVEKYFKEDPVELVGGGSSVADRQKEGAGRLVDMRPDDSSSGTYNADRLDRRPDANDENSVASDEETGSEIGQQGEQNNGLSALDGLSLKEETTGESNLQMASETNSPAGGDEIASHQNEQMGNGNRQDDVNLIRNKADVLDKTLPDHQLQDAKPGRTIPPGDPNVMVITVGDPLLAEPLELALEEYLGQDQVRLMDEDYFSELGNYIGNESVDIGALGKTAYGLGGDVLILTETQYVGEREVRPLNRPSTIYSARIKVRCILLGSNQSLGPTFRDQIEYNSLTATRNAEAAMLKISGQINRLLKGL